MNLKPKYWIEVVLFLLLWDLISKIELYKNKIKKTIFEKIHFKLILIV